MHGFRTEAEMGIALKAAAICAGVIGLAAMALAPSAVASSTHGAVAAHPLRSTEQALAWASDAAARVVGHLAVKARAVRVSAPPVPNPRA